jgi:hypothetical protein
MADPKKITEATSETVQRTLGPSFRINGIGGESDVEEVNAAAFELYKEAGKVVSFAANLLDEAASAKGGWPRNQAICAGLIIRISKFMLVVVQLSAKRNRAEVVSALNRSIMESAINLEFLASTNDDKFFDQFVKFSLGPEKELYDVIQAKIAARSGKVLPIEERMLKSINNVCQASAVKIEDVDRKYGDWGGGIKERLKALNKEELYLALQRIPSHAVHGTWVDLIMNDLEHDSKTGVFRPHPEFSLVDARLLGAPAIFALEATKRYLERFFSGIPECKLLLERIDDLEHRIREAHRIHEELLSKEE